MDLAHGDSAITRTSSERQRLINYVSTIREGNETKDSIAPADQHDISVTGSRFMMLGIYCFVLMIANAAERTKLWYRHQVRSIIIKLDRTAIPTSSLLT